MVGWHPRQGLAILEATGTDRRIKLCRRFVQRAARPDGERRIAGGRDLAAESMMRAFAPRSLLRSPD
jgi:hypothetical protein